MYYYFYYLCVYKLFKPIMKQCRILHNVNWTVVLNHIENISLKYA